MLTTKEKKMFTYNFCKNRLRFESISVNSYFLLENIDFLGGDVIYIIAQSEF